MRYFVVQMLLYKNNNIQTKYNSLKKLIIKNISGKYIHKILYKLYFNTILTIKDKYVKI